MKCITEKALSVLTAATIPTDAVIGRKVNEIRAAIQYLTQTRNKHMGARTIRQRKDVILIMDELYCYSCIQCMRELHDPVIWCSLSGKVIDDGFGIEGDCTICNKFIPCRSHIYSGGHADSDEPLPF